MTESPALNLIEPKLVAAARASANRAAVRVLHVINGEHYAGAERVQDQLALRLPELGYEVGFVCVKPNRFAAMRCAQTAPLVEMPMRSRFDLRPALKLARHIRRDNYALIHTHTPRAALVGRFASALAGVPMVHHMHSQTSTEIKRRWFSRWSAAVERFTVRRATTIAVSASLCRHLRQTGYAERPVHLVPNGVPARGALPPLRPPVDREWTIGTLAMFRPRKGIEVLLAALGLLRSSGLRIRLRGVGGFETAAYERECKQFAASLGLDSAVDWTGFRQDVNAELAAMDIFVLPSVISEGMPMALLEAMAAGTPVVGTRVDGTTDLIRDGVEGLLAAPNDAADLARALGQIVRGEVDWAAMRTAAHQRHAEEFSDRSMAAGVAAVYDEILSNLIHERRAEK